MLYILGTNFLPFCQVGTYSLQVLPTKDPILAVTVLVVDVDVNE